MQSFGYLVSAKAYSLASRCSYHFSERKGRARCISVGMNVKKYKIFFPSAQNICRGIYIKLCEKMLRCTLEDPDNILEIKSYLMRLILEIIRDVKAQIPEELAPAFELISSRYKENLTVKEYADSCHMSESYFRKKFTELTGRSPIQYRNELRFAEARKLYSDGATINEIANELGFFDAGYFSKMYKKCNGHTLRSESDKDMI